MVSAIITTFNRPVLFERALKSVLRQSYRDFEIIVVDDCSSESYAIPRGVRWFRLPENKGLSYARNFGISKAQGMYVVCLDDDNELLPDFLQKTVDLIGDDDAIAVTSDSIQRFR